MPKTHAFIIIFIALSISLAATASAESAAGLVEKGNAAFAAGQIDDAIAAYDKALEKNPDAPRIHYDKGCALYMKQAYDEAADMFSQATLKTDDPVFAAKSHFNLGNSLFQKGSSQENVDLESRAEALENSVRQYEKALDFDPSLDAAGNNLEIARMALKSVREAIKKQQPSEKPQEGTGNSDRQQQPDQQQPPQQQQAENPSQQTGEQDAAQQAETAGSEDPEKILREEQEHRLYRQSTDGAYRPVEKDW